MTWRMGVVESVERQWEGAQQLQVREVPGGNLVSVICYLELVGRADIGERVIFTSNALGRGLGTGGVGFVAAIPDHLPSDPPTAPGHVMKARYTPLQTMVLGVDEQDSPHHDILAGATSLDGMPVVTADLHSALPAIIAGARLQASRLGRPEPRIAYVMTDGGALPVWFSRQVATLRARGDLAATITVGQAFGGDHDAVNVHSGLLAAHLVTDADLAIVSQGPGNLGTGTRWGFSGTQVGEVINAAAVLGGTPIGSLRISASDRRERHLGISHHSLTAYSRVALRPADVVLPTRWASVLSDHGITLDLDERIRGQLPQLGTHHRIVEVSVAGLDTALRAVSAELSSMGRGYDADPTPFLAAGVAGMHAVNRLASVVPRDERS